MTISSSIADGIKESLQPMTTSLEETDKRQWNVVLPVLCQLSSEQKKWIRIGGVCTMIMTLAAVVIALALVRMNFRSRTIS